METDKLATLVSMGFDIDLCEAILQVENLTLEEAIQRLLKAQQKDEYTRNELPVAQPSDTTMQQATDYQPLESDRNRQEGTADPSNDSTELVLSRLALSDRQREIKNEFERKEREEVQVAVKKRKIQAKHEKGLILQEIEANKKRLKDLRESKSVLQGECQGTSQEAASIATDSKESVSDICKIQIRLPTGRAINRKFKRNLPLSAVIDFAIENLEEEIERKDAILMQPFPRQEFTSLDHQRSLQSLGLFPNASLVLMLQKHASQSGSSNIVQQENPVHPTENTTKAHSDGASKVQSVHYTPPVQHYVWGGGSRLCGNYQPEDQHELEADPQTQGRRGEICQSSFLRSVLSHPENTSNTNREVRPERGKYDTVPYSTAPLASTSGSTDDAHRQQSNLMMEAIQKRRAQFAASVASHPKSEAVRLERDIHSLVDLCADCVAKNLAVQNGFILSFIGKTLSQQAASQVIAELKKRKLLTGKLLQLFHPCKLSILDLNCYSLTSNEILEAARFHSTIMSLRLSQCAIITDIGVVTVVKGLKHLQNLDLSGCIQVTDRSLSEIKCLQDLRSLKLDSTKVKDKGVEGFLRGQNRTNLMELSLNSTTVTERAFDYQENAANLPLMVLLLDHTMVSSLEFLRGFPYLRQISLSGTPLRSDSLPAVSDLKHLGELNLTQTKLTDDALQHIVGLPLRTFGLPDRLVITDSGLRYIEGLPLSSLDLADYIRITDAGMASIGKISSLTSLSLSNTKITDEGLHYIKGLTSLQELDLARTVISNDGVRSLKGLRSLHTLNLSSTRITNAVFRDGTINSFENLVKLNISRNRISDAGINQLRLVFLEVINADQTYTSPSTTADTTGCPNLKTLRARNCNLLSELSEDE